ncbi:MAG: hypothetical protein JXB45_01750, partial [Candidatus Krumholzibacteriota bacterium]|nr:hypothetical protein [Candidatus Krumholzibacteriota bacterium]
MNKIMVVILLILFSLTLIQCESDEVTEPKNNGGGSDLDSIAAYWFQEMGDMMEDLGDMDMEEIKNLDLSPIEDGFNYVLSRNFYHATARLGMAIMEIMEIDKNSEVWEVIESLDAWGNSEEPAPPGGSRRLLGNQFSMLVRVPRALSLNQIVNFPDNISIERIQDIIATVIIPALDRSINDLSMVEYNTATRITLNFSSQGIDDTYYIDLGEVYFFDAAVHALRAAFKLAISWDVDLFGPDGTYNWIDDMGDLDHGDYCPFYVRTDVGGGLYDLELIRRYDYFRSQSDSILIAVLHHNLNGRPAFLTLRDHGITMSTARADLITMITKLESSVNFINNTRPEHTEYNVIKLADLTDLNDDIPGDDPPNFASGFNTINDVLSWAKNDLLGGTVTFQEELGSSHTLFTWKMNISVLLDGTIDDWKDMLPYHQWNLPGLNRWIVVEHDPLEDNCGYPYGHYWDGDLMEDEGCEYTEFFDINQACYRYYDYWLPMGDYLQLLESPGGRVLDLSVDKFPYFPNNDYTFKGLFPQMTRADWLTLVDILD